MTKLVLLGIFVLLSYVIATPTIIASNGAIFNFEGPSPEPGECQVCMQMYGETMDPANGYFRVAYPRLAEINGTGGECCITGGNCPIGTGCNGHVIYFNPVFTVNSSSNAASFDGYLRGGGGSQSSPCTPPGTTLICVQHQIEIELNDGPPANYTIAPGQVFDVPTHSLRTTIRVLDWSFAAGSQGLRLVFQLMTRLNTMKHFYLQPGNVDSATESVGTNTFRGVTMEDSTGYKGSVYFANYANIDGVATPVDISGLYPHAYDDSSRYVYIDIPIHTNYMEYTYHTHMDNLIGVGSSDLSFIEANKFYFIAAGAVLGFLIICFFCCVVFCKCRASRGHHHDHKGGYD